MIYTSIRIKTATRDKLRARGTGSLDDIINSLLVDEPIQILPKPQLQIPEDIIDGVPQSFITQITEMVNGLGYISNKDAVIADYILKYKEKRKNKKT